MTNQDRNLPLESLEGVVERVTFVNGFFSINVVRVVKSSFKHPQSEMTVVGHFGRLQVGQPYRFIGQLQHSYRYGDQFVVTKYQHID